jgi:hypothetical protein
VDAGAGDPLAAPGGGGPGGSGGDAAAAETSTGFDALPAAPPG